jgi:hypothetical protein
MRLEGRFVLQEFAEARDLHAIAGAGHALCTSHAGRFWLTWHQIGAKPGVSAEQTAIQADFP